MATTDVRIYHEPLVLDAEHIRQIAQRWLESYQGDCDKASDVEDNCYYQGGVDAISGLLSVMIGEETA